MSSELLGHTSKPALMAVAEATIIGNLEPKSTPLQDPVEAKNNADSNISPTPVSGQPVRPHAAHGHRGEPDSDDDHDRLLTAAQVKRRYGSASDMWLWRRLHDSSGFPEPLLICGRRFWKLSALIAWERSRTKGGA